MKNVEFSATDFKFVEKKISCACLKVSISTIVSCEIMGTTTATSAHTLAVASAVLSYAQMSTARIVTMSTSITVLSEGMGSMSVTTVITLAADTVA